MGYNKKQKCSSPQSLPQWLLLQSPPSRSTVRTRWRSPPAPPPVAAAADPPPSPRSRLSTETAALPSTADPASSTLTPPNTAPMDVDTTVDMVAMVAMVTTDVAMAATVMTTAMAPMTVTTTVATITVTDVAMDTDTAAVATTTE